MSRVDWELLSWISTTIGVFLATLGVFAVAVQLYLQRKQSRLEFLDRLYAQLDTHEARLARRYIYLASPDELRLKVLHSPGFEDQRRLVEETLATFERLTYPIVQRQVPSEDAFNLYGGVLLSVAYQLWPYVEDQRDLRRASGRRHRLGYRRYLETVIHEWAPKYAEAASLPPPPKGLSTNDLLHHLFPAVVSAA